MNPKDTNEKKAPVIIELSPQQLGKVTGGLTLQKIPIFLEVGPRVLNPGIRYHRCPTPPDALGVIKVLGG